MNGHACPNTDVNCLTVKYRENRENFKIIESYSIYIHPKFPLSSAVERVTSKSVILSNDMTRSVVRIG